MDSGVYMHDDLTTWHNFCYFKGIVSARDEWRRHEFFDLSSDDEAEENHAEDASDAFSIYIHETGFHCSYIASSLPTKTIIYCKSIKIDVTSGRT